MARLEGKVSLVTGAGSGIGRGIALVFASEGSTVIAVDRMGESAEETAKMIKEKGGKVSVQKGDVSLARDVEKIIRQAIQSYGQVNVLVNVAGGALGVNSPVGNTTEAEWDRVIANNVKSTFLMSKNMLPFMIKNGGGVIINIGSIFGLFPAPGMAAYSAAKAAVINLTRQMALDYGHHNIRVNCLCPGPIRTPALEPHLKTHGEEMRAATLVGRLGKPEDVAYGALYLASDESSFVTGTALIIDGGSDPRLVRPRS